VVNRSPEEVKELRMSLLRILRTNEDGQDLVEYALLAAMAAAVTTLGQAIAAQYQAIASIF
jgi:Flp pilus assembly pilin Flp